MNKEIDFSVQADRTNIVLEMIQSGRAFLDVFGKILVQTNAQQEDEEFDRIMDSASKDKLIAYLHSPTVRHQILQKINNDPLIQQYYECFDILEQNHKHPPKYGKPKGPKEVYDLFLKSLKAKCRKGDSMTLKEDYKTLVNQAAKCFITKSNDQGWELKLPTSQFACSFCQQQFSSSSGLKAHERAKKHWLQQQQLAKIQDQDEAEDI